jgi:hypothetical protein
VQPKPDVEGGERARQDSIARYAQDAKAWWDSGRVYYIVKLSLGGTVAGLVSHAESDAEDVSGIVQQIGRSAGTCTTSATCISRSESARTLSRRRTS